MTASTADAMPITKRLRTWVLWGLTAFTLVGLIACSKNSASPANADTANEQAVAADEGVMVVVPAGDFICE